MDVKSQSGREGGCASGGGSARCSSSLSPPWTSGSSVRVITAAELLKWGWGTVHTATALQGGAGGPEVPAPSPAPSPIKSRLRMPGSLGRGHACSQLSPELRGAFGFQDLTFPNQPSTPYRAVSTKQMGSEQTHQRERQTGQVRRTVMGEGVVLAL